MLNEVPLHAKHDIAHLLDRFRHALLTYLESQPKLPPELRQYVSSGKHLRPLLCLIGAQHFDCDTREAERAAVALELVHCAALLHDDVLDEHSERRMLPTLRQHFGKHASVILGNLLLGHAFELAPPRALPALGIALASLSYASFLESRGCRDSALSSAEPIAVGKTSSLFEAALQIPQCISEIVPLNEPLKTYSRELGVAFQLLNDLKDLRHSQVAGEFLGDLKYRHPSLIFSLFLGPAHLEPYLSGADVDQSLFLTELADSGIVTAVEQEIRKRKCRAREAASALDQGFHTILTSFANMVIPEMAFSSELEFL